MYAWRHIPVIRIVIPFILGIIVAHHIDSSYSIIAGLFASVLTVSLLLHLLLRSRINLTLQQVLSVLILVSFFLAGVLITTVHSERKYQNHYANIAEYDGLLLVRVTNQPEEKQKSIGCKVELVQVKNKLEDISVSGRAQLYLAKDDSSRNIQYGDFLLIGNQLKLISEPKNPYQFNFAQYYANQNIYHQAFIDSSHWIRLNTNESNFIWKLSYDIRDYLKSKFNTYYPDKDIRGVAEALVFGYKDELNEDWLEAFSRTGTIHVLAVSGLHVGIIFLLLNLVFGINRSEGKWLIIKSFAVILCLFAYCMLTGFAPSVSRATLMFSTVVLGRAFNRQSNIYNTLALSAFILLVINPLNLFHVGFQFSYLAVLGIVYFKDVFRSWIPAKTWLQDKIASLLAVSVAAQITTFPLGLYYFHQYPNLFFISNLIVIPCITVVLYLALAAIVMGLFSAGLATFIANISAMYIEFISATVHKIQDIPYAFFDGLHITFAQMLMLYAVVITCTITLQFKWAKGWVVLAASVAGFIVSDFYYEKGLNTKEVVVFDVRNETLIGFKNESTFTAIATPRVYANPSTYDYILEPYLVNERCDLTYQMIPLEIARDSMVFSDIKSLGNGVIYYDSKSYLFLDYLDTYVNDTLKVDFLIVGKTKNQTYLSKVLPLIKSESIIYLNNWRNDGPKSIRRENNTVQSRYIVMSD